MNINWSNVKLCVTNYRWYIAVVWALLLLPIWFLPMVAISLISTFFAWFALQLSDIVDEMRYITQEYLTWAVRWFYRSLPKDVVDKG
ncbi:predicted ORF [Xanthomonas phage XacN1]|nr:predicted ORF [Xanthomonas phage XacN1]